MKCKDCPKKPTCEKLCDEANEYVNQDYVYPTIWDWNDTDLVLPEELDRANVLSEWQKGEVIQPPQNILVFFMYHVDKYTQVEIADILGISQQRVSKILNKPRRTNKII